MLIDLSPLRKNINFRYLFVGQLVSFIGTMITSVAIPYEIYHVTQSTFWVGILSAFQLMPLLFTALLGGSLADRLPRKPLLLWSNVALALGSLLLAVNSYFFPETLWSLFILAMWGAGFAGLYRPTTESLVQQIVAKEDYAAVSALKSLAISMGMIAGPALGGLILAVFGLTIAYLVDALTFIIFMVLLLLMQHFPTPQRNDDENILQSIISGARYAKSRPELLGTYFVDFFAMIFGMPDALFPAIAAHLGGVRILGFLYAAPALGALVVSLTSRWTVSIQRHGRAIACAAFFWGVAIIGFGLSHQVLWALFFLVLAGAFDGLSGIFRMTMWNETIPQALRGRLAGIELISYVSGPYLGNAEAGLVASLFGITFAVVSGGAMCLLTVVGCCWYFPKLWYYKRSP